MMKTLAIISSLRRKNTYDVIQQIEFEIMWD